MKDKSHFLIGSNCRIVFGHSPALIKKCLTIFDYVFEWKILVSLGNIRGHKDRGNTGKLTSVDYMVDRRSKCILSLVVLVVF